VSDSDVLPMMAELMLDAMLSCVEEQSAHYVAGPLATGLRYYEAAAGQEVKGEEVRRANEADMRMFVARLRADSGEPVIDSGRLRIPSWTPREHGAFFLEVIHRMSKDVVFMNGWEYSTGATKEFVYAQAQGVPTLDAGLQVLSLGRAAELIGGALAAAEELGHPNAEVFERRLLAVRELASGGQVDNA